MAVLDQSSYQNLTSRIQPDNTFSWTAPNDGAEWIVVASYMNGTGQSVRTAMTPTASYLVDHFSSDGINAVIDYWNTKVLTPELRSAMQAGGGSLFFDSLEINGSTPGRG